MNYERTISLNENVTTYLQMLNYEADGYRVLCIHAAEYGLPEEQRKDIIQKFGESFAEYRMALDETVRWAVPEAEQKDTFYFVDFLRSRLVLRGIK